MQPQEIIFLYLNNLKSISHIKWVIEEDVNKSGRTYMQLLWIYMHVSVSIYNGVSNRICGASDSSGSRWDSGLLLK